MQNWEFKIMPIFNPIHRNYVAHKYITTSYVWIFCNLCVLSPILSPGNKIYLTPDAPENRKKVEMGNHRQSFCMKFHEINLFCDLDINADFCTCRRVRIRKFLGYMYQVLNLEAGNSAKPKLNPAKPTKQSVLLVACLASCSHYTVH